jgi:hypothetical protein
MGRRGIAWVAVLLFAVSWFVDAHVGLEVASGAFSRLDEFVDELAKSAPREDADLTEAPRRRRLSEEVPFGRGRGVGVAEGPPGWQAFRVAWDLLLDGDTWSKAGRDLRPLLLGLTSLTNLAMIAAVIALLSRSGRARGLGVVLAVCAALDAGWLYLTDAGFRDGLRAGYYLWLGSFTVAAFGFLRRPA